MLPFSRKKEKQELKKFSISHDLTQLITEATRVTETSRTLLDVIVVNNDHRITDSGVVPVPLSDHYLVYCVLKAGVIKARVHVKAVLMSLYTAFLPISRSRFKGR